MLPTILRAICSLPMYLVVFWKKKWTKWLTISPTKVFYASFSDTSHYLTQKIISVNRKPIIDIPLKDEEKRVMSSSCIVTAPTKKRDTRPLARLWYVLPHDRVQGARKSIYLTHRLPNRIQAYKYLRANRQIVEKREKNLWRKKHVRRAIFWTVEVRVVGGICTFNLYFVYDAAAGSLCDL